VKRLRGGFLLAGLAALLPQRAHALAAGADFLRAEIPARPAAIAGAFAAFDDDVSAFLWNPAALSALKQPLVGATHFTSIVDTAFDQASFVQPLRVWDQAAGIGLSIQDSSTSNFDQIDSNGNDVGAVENYDLVLLVGGGLRLSKTLGLGLNLKTFNSRLAEFRSRGFAVDLGLQSQLNPRVSFGVALMDVGAQEAYDQVADPLPTLFRLGVKGVVIKDEETTLQVAAQLDRPWATNGPITLAVGAEYWYRDMVAFRSGWRFGEDLGPFSLGLGFKYQGFNLDYAYNSLGDLGQTHRFSVGAELGTLFQRLGWTVKPIEGLRPDRSDPNRISAPLGAR
jgi:hypothetical protein